MCFFNEVMLADVVMFKDMVMFEGMVMWPGDVEQRVNTVLSTVEPEPGNHHEQRQRVSANELSDNR